MLGAFALQMVGFGGILTLALLGCMIGIAGMSTVAADVLHVAPFPTSERRGFWYEATFGFRWIWREPDLSRLLIFIMGYNLVSSVYAVTFTPYLLSWTPVHTLGVAAGLEGGAAVLAGFSLAYFGDRVRAEARVICAAALFGLVLTVWGLARASGTLYGLAFCAGTLTSLIVASLQSVWQSNTPIDIQGKVFAARRMVSYLLIPVAVLASVPLSRRVFAPWLRSDPFVTSIWGAGQGGALGMMLSALGICLVAGCAWYASQRRLLRFRAPIVVPE